MLNDNLEQQAKTLYLNFCANLKSKSLINFEDNPNHGTLVMGLSPKGTSYNTCGLGLPLLNGAADYTGLILTPKKFTSDPTRLCHKDDIVFCIRATIGLTVFADRDYCIGRGVAAISNINENYREFVFELIDESIEVFKQNANGSVIQGISKDDVLKLKVVNPSLDEIARFHSYMKPIFNHMASIRVENARLAELRDSLLPKLMSGELDITEIEL